MKICLYQKIAIEIVPDFACKQRLLIYKLIYNVHNKFSNTIYLKKRQNKYKHILLVSIKQTY